jgi:hypothetical protein
MKLVVILVKVYRVIIKGRLIIFCIDFMKVDDTNAVLIMEATFPPELGWAGFIVSPSTPLRVTIPSTPLRVTIPSTPLRVTIPSTPLRVTKIDSAQGDENRLRSG